jgi:hypothetical protein
MRFGLLIMLVAAASASAQTTYRWTDKEGKVHYGDQPPAANEAKSVQQKKSSQLGVIPQEPSYSQRQAMADFPVTFYSHSQCGEPCTNGRDHLTKRGVPFADKDVAGAADLATLKSLLGGDPVLPVLQVGSRLVKGYQAGAWDNLLDAAGYAKPKAKTGQP